MAFTCCCRKMGIVARVGMRRLGGPPVLENKDCNSGCTVAGVFRPSEVCIMPSQGCGLIVGGETGSLAMIKANPTYSTFAMLQFRYDQA